MSRPATANLHPAATAALSILLGCAYAYVLVGWRLIDPTNLSWLKDDPATSYLGWAFYRQQPNLSFPIGWSTAIGYPLGEPIAYLDSMPLLAFISWLLRDVLPAEFQYLGLWFVACSCLQFYFGHRLSRRLCGSGPSAVLGGLLFLTAPVFTWRAFGHFALVSQWFILAAIDLLLAAGAGLSRRATIWSILLCLMAASINPYVAVMTLLVCCAAHLRSVITGGSRPVPAALAVVSSATAVVAGFLIFGFFLIGSDTSLYAGPAYEMTSMNLLSLIDPQQWGSVLLKAQPIAYALQYEGYNYLGLGMLLLGVIAVARSPAATRVLLSRGMAPVVGVVIVSLLLALSTRGTLGTHTIYHLKPPALVMIGLQSLRASGRLFWPGYYLLFAAALAGATRAFPRRWLPLALAATVLVQFVDMSEIRTEIRRAWGVSSLPTLHDPAWSDLGREHRHLAVFPAYQCSPQDTPGGTNGYAIFGLMAAGQSMTINSFYAGRYSNAQIHYYCVQQILDVQRDGMQADTAYLFPAARSALVVGLNTGSHYCRPVDGFILCSHVPGKRGLDPVVASQIPELPRGAIVSFEGEGPVAKQVLGEGWSFPEAWGRWSLGETSELSFRIPDPEKPVAVELSVRPFVTPGRRQRVEVEVNGETLPAWDITLSDDTHLSISIPAGVIGSDGLVRMELRFPDALTPESVGAGADTRLLAVGLLELRIGT